MDREWTQNCREMNDLISQTTLGTPIEVKQVTSVRPDEYKIIDVRGYWALGLGQYVPESPG